MIKATWRGGDGKKGIVLLVTVIFMSVMLAFGLALASLAYKQSVLSSGATQSLSAFYAADAALECTLYADQRLGAFLHSSFTGNPNAAVLMNHIAVACDGDVINDGTSVPTATWNATRLMVYGRISFNNGKGCADITIFKHTTPQSDGHLAYLFSTGYNVGCGAISTAGARVVVRGISLKY